MAPISAPRREKDLGKKTDRVAQAMKTYEPDGTWKLVAD
jgi:hypothetical protein